MKPRLNFEVTKDRDYYIILRHPIMCSLDHYKITKSMIKISKLTGRPISRYLRSEAEIETIYVPCLS